MERLAPSVVGASSASVQHISDTFGALVREYVLGYPFTAPGLPSAGIDYVAGRLLLFQTKGGNVSVESWPDGEALKFAACLFVLLVQENLVHGKQYVLGLSAQSIYSHMNLALRAACPARESFVQAVAAVDLIGTAASLLRHKEVVAALIECEELSEFCAGEARWALGTMDPSGELAAENASLVTSTDLSVQPEQVALHPVLLPRLRLSPLPIGRAARPRLRSLTGAMAIGGVFLAIGALLPVMLRGQPTNEDDPPGILGRENCSVTGCLPETSLVPLVFISLYLLMLLVRPSDRSLFIFRCLCASVAIVAIMAASAAALRVKATSSWYETHWRSEDPAWVLYRLQPLEAAILLVLSLLLLFHTVYVYLKFTWGASQRRESPTGAAISVPKMDLGLVSIWRAVRLLSFCSGISFFSFNALRVVIRASRGDTFEGRGYFIDAIVGIILMAFSAAITPRLRLRLQLSQLPLHRMTCCTTPLSRRSADLPTPAAGVINLSELRGACPLNVAGASVSVTRPLATLDKPVAAVPTPPMHSEEPGSSSSTSRGSFEGPVSPAELSLGFDLRLQGEIGRGSAGVVFAGTVSSTGRPVAVKVLGSVVGVPPRVLHQVAAEVRTAMRLHHEHIVEMLGIGMIADEASAAYQSPVVVMELVEGGTLERMLDLRNIERRPRLSGLSGVGLVTAERELRVPMPLKIRLAYELAQAVECLHAQGVLHCDVKLSNVLLTPGDEPRVKLGGCPVTADLINQQGVQRVGVRGTPRYMAPEVAFRELNPSSDVYSFGVCFYELLHETTFEVPEARDGLDQLLIAMTAKRPKTKLSAGQLSALDATGQACANAAAELIEQCWQHSWEERPTMQDVVTRLSRESALLHP